MISFFLKYITVWSLKIYLSRRDDRNPIDR